MKRAFSECSYTPCTNPIGVTDSYCAAHVIGTPYMNKKQRRLLGVYESNRVLGQEVFLPLPPNSEVQLAPCKEQREKDTCYWVNGYKKKWNAKRFYNACLQTGCKIVPSFGIPDDENERPTYCKTHKLDGMENVVKKHCKEDGCKKGPCYGMPEDKRPTYCSTHKLDGMENIVSKRRGEMAEKQRCFF